MLTVFSTYLEPVSSFMGFASSISNATNSQLFGRPVYKLACEAGLVASRLTMISMSLHYIEGVTVYAIFDIS